MRGTPLDEREMLSYYEGFDEAGRLESGEGSLELARMKDLIQRFLASPPQVVLDIGGGPGRYACWLARNGHGVHLVDAVPPEFDSCAYISGLDGSRGVDKSRLCGARHEIWARFT